MKQFIVATLFVIGVGFPQNGFAEKGSTTGAPASKGAPTTPPPSSDSPADIKPDGEYYGVANPVLGDFSFGPAVTLIAFPVPFKLGLETKYRDCFGLSFDYGFFPSLTFSSVSVGWNSWNVTAKWYPFNRAMYLGVGIGQQTFEGSKTESVTVGPTTQPLTVTVAVNTTFINPHLGWRFISNSGFFYGMELGVQVPISNSATVTSSDSTLNSTTEFQEASADVDAKAKTFGRTPLPLLTVAQIGWMF